MLKLPKEQKEAIIDSVISYFETERSESLGRLGAESLVDLLLKELGPVVYNQAIQDARRFIGERMLAIEEDLYSLEMRSERARGGRGADGR